ncbi:flagellar protein FlaG [Moritella marina ATCC 15381]|uniref:Flagellar protein FlaG n=1 Tax=Moritella marina ATCC 15381 TaxID=1202962 RepID=A0A5J6WF42_MORMI|nr:flagellar protein FlaG [Moritella marina]QFI36573.1 flagellar protein FlaG [Moritella marina ATCC 15381]
MSIDNSMDNKSTRFYPDPVMTKEPVITNPAVLISPSENPLPEKTPLSIPKLANDIDLEQKLLEAKDTLQAHFDANNKKLNFSVHDDTGRMLVKIVDPDSGEILKELPSEEVLKMAANIEKFQDNVSARPGLLFDEMV